MIGVLRAETLAWIMQRATETNVPLGEFDPTVEIDIAEPPITDLYQVAVFYGGSLDESFYFVSPRELATLIAEWIGQDCQRESDNDADHAKWKVILYDASMLDPTPVVAKFQGGGSAEEE